MPTSSHHHPQPSQHPHTRLAISPAAPQLLLAVLREVQAESVRLMDQSAFPARARSRCVTIDGQDTQVTTISFADKLLFTISQAGTLAHWIHVPMSSYGDALPAPRLDLADSDLALLPAAYLTATTVLGGTRQTDETFGQTLASTVASSILLKHPEESRMLVLGIGLHRDAELDKAQFDSLLEALLPMI